MRSIRQLALALPFVLAACGGGSKSSAPPTGTSTGAVTDKPAGGGATPTKAWHAMNHDERRAYMKNVVFPKMQAEFVAMDKKYADMTCETCHGDGVADKTFKMPNPKLPKLNFKDGLAEWKEKAPEMLKFMGEKVKPDMAALVGEQPMSESNPKGFGCLECHTMAE
jgi:hypothetical protein